MLASPISSGAVVPFSNSSLPLSSLPLANYTENREEKLFSKRIERCEAAAKAHLFTDGLQRLVSTEDFHSFRDLKPLSDLFQLMAREENETVKEAFIKKEGYSKRFFSKESWEEWVENRTHLGRVASLYIDYVNGSISQQHLQNTLSSETIRKANGEAAVVLKRLSQPQRPAEMSDQSAFWVSLNSASSALQRISTLLTFPPLVGAATVPKVVKDKQVNKEKKPAKKKEKTCQTAIVLENELKLLQEKIARAEKNAQAAALESELRLLEERKRAAEQNLGLVALEAEAMHQWSQDQKDLMERYHQQREAFNTIMDGFQQQFLGSAERLQKYHADTETRRDALLRQKASLEEEYAIKSGTLK